MTTHAFAPWVEPIAAGLRKSRSEIAAFASSAPDDIWDKPSANPGWTNKDLLAHLATGHWVLQGFLRVVLFGEPFGDPRGPDPGNAERVAERRDTPVAELIAEVGTEGEETQELLAQLREEHAERQPFARGLASFGRHEYFHLNQLREAAGMPPLEPPESGSSHA